MKINKLYFLNFRCFEELWIFPFSSQMNIFIGDNASGKTAILEAISDLLFPFCEVMIKQSETPNPERNIRRVVTNDNVELAFPFVYSIDLSLPYNINAVGKIKAMYKIMDNEAYGETIMNNFNSEFLIDGAKTYKKKITENEIFPLIAYYNTARLWGQNYTIPKEESKPNGSRTQGYANALPVTDMSFKDFILRWKTLEFEEYASKREEIALTVMKGVLRQGIKDCKNVYFSTKQDTLVFQNEKDEIYPFYLLSDGYKNMLAMLGDIAHRCYTLNPHLKEKACLETTGIVLIDEIDLHLHPKWQKTIIQDLKRIFPNIQFIVTTHSPLIIASAGKGEIFNLSEIKDNTLNPNSSSYNGLDIDFILQALMGLGIENVEAKDIETALERWILLESREKQESPYLIEMNGNSYSLIDILREVETDSEIGKKFKRDLIMLTIELLFRGKEQLNGA